LKRRREGPPEYTYMNYENTRGALRPTLSLRYGAAIPKAASERMPAAAMIPARELQRLVASMVD